MGTNAYDLTAMRSFSGHLFGSPHRLPVAVLAACAEPEELYAGAIAKAAGVERKEARRLLLGMHEAGMLNLAEKALALRGSPRLMIRVEDHYAWGAVIALGDGFLVDRDDRNLE